MDVQVTSDVGKGRAFVVLAEVGTYESSVTELASSLSGVGRVLSLNCPIVDDRSWSGVTTSLQSALADLGVRQASFVTFGSSSALVQNLYLQNPKLVRSVVYVDATTRPHPSFLARSIDHIETRLPLGLPLRLRTRGFDGKPFLQRLRCPSLVVVSSEASVYQRDQARVLARHIPTSWHVELPQKSELEFLCNLVRDFRDVPAKCPQKALRASS